LGEAGHGDSPLRWLLRGGPVSARRSPPRGTHATYGPVRHASGKSPNKGPRMTGYTQSSCWTQPPGGSRRPSIRDR
jgi:hypothetical protein